MCRNIFCLFNSDTFFFCFCRFIIAENINHTGVGFFAVFDGHGGEFAADYARDYLVPNLYNKITESSNLLKGTKPNEPFVKPAKECDDDDNDEKDAKKDDGKTTSAQRKASFRKSYSTAEDCIGKPNCNQERDIFMDKLNSIVRTKDSFLNRNTQNVKPKEFDAKCYIDNGKINFGKILTDETLLADYKLNEAAKKQVNI